ncbi:MAG: hypothetical protein Q7S74_01200 [Nanoarchaeota archaeon]|nr:hypothetical protein [Nanoarchaeota archaeon]
MEDEKEATITIIKTINGDYGLHGDRHWDALPYWVHYPACITLLNASGMPGKFRIFTDREQEIYGSPISEKEYAGIRNIAEDWVLEKAGELENNGYKLDIKFEEDYSPREMKGGMKTW